MTFKSSIHLIPTLLITFCILSCSDLKKEKIESLRWMSETSEIIIPDSIKELKIYDNHEWVIIVKFKLTENIFKEFIKVNGLTQYEVLHNENNLFIEDGFDMLLLNEIEEISLDENFIKTPTNYYTLSDCKTGNSWTLLANKKSKTIWFEVLYPDNSGDIAPCEKERELKFSTIYGLNKVQGEQIRITKKNDKSILFKKDKDGSWTEYRTYDLINVENNSYSFLLKSRLGIGLCKSGKWNKPFLGIGIGFDTTAYKILKNADFQITSQHIKLDTTLKLIDMVTYHEMPSNSDEHVNVDF